MRIKIEVEGSTIVIKDMGGNTMLKVTDLGTKRYYDYDPLNGNLQRGLERVGERYKTFFRFGDDETLMTFE